ncbi:hypothetical protein PGT21_021958 [Puccinia graminis f. sp. tritici]|uniref:Uncharacterized protein n=1 Tax=Puccinia graminis f. sp. tritici TaxID=56615 RepID=A0A5B0S191_PUCGR|nr:hypothetical protein PGT21_021958 [Puccinia graminis f. sp. tritici]KAA1131647.1 hypothetical protein PGTUg99_034599 [Puccinia graminis f. sp. tritici]
MQSERPRDALASQHHLDASKSIQVTLAKYEASNGRYDLFSIGHSPTKSVRWMTVFSVSIGHFELQFLIGASGRWLKKASKAWSMVEKHSENAVDGRKSLQKCGRSSKNAPKVQGSDASPDVSHQIQMSREQIEVEHATTLAPSKRQQALTKTL